VFKGCNVENASYGTYLWNAGHHHLHLLASSGGAICAERTAIVKAVVSPALPFSLLTHSFPPAAQSEGKKDFVAIAVTTYAAPVSLCTTLTPVAATIPTTSRRVASAARSSANSVPSTRPSCSSPVITRDTRPRAGRMSRRGAG
jgi:hypothetical protein